MTHINFANQVSLSKDLETQESSVANAKPVAIDRFVQEVLPSRPAEKREVDPEKWKIFWADFLQYASHNLASSRRENRILFSNSIKEALKQIESHIGLSGDSEINFVCDWTDTGGVEKFLENIKYPSTLKKVILWLPDGKVVEVNIEDGEALSEPRNGLFDINQAKGPVYWQATKVHHFRSTDWVGKVKALADQKKFNELADDYYLLTGDKISPDTIAMYTRQPKEIVSFLNLARMSALTGCNLKEMIEGENRRNFPDVDPSVWRTTYYPIYLEKESDLSRILFYAQSDPQRKSAGWMIFAARKNPQNYKNPHTLAQVAELSESLIKGYEFNTVMPTPYAMGQLIKILLLDEAQFIEAINSTFLNPDRKDGQELRQGNVARAAENGVLEKMKKIYPGFHLWLDPSSKDFEKIAQYSSRPGSLGQVFFLIRKVMRGGRSTYLSALDMHEESDMGNYHLWNRVELHDKGFNKSHLGYWIDLLRQLKLPEKVILQFLDATGWDPKSVGVRVALARGSKSLHQSVEGSSVGVELMERVSRTPKPLRLRSKKVLALAETLGVIDPELNKRLMKGIGQFFPETYGDKPHLCITPAILSIAQGFNLGQFLFFYRMENRLSLKHMSQLTGLSAPALYGYETAQPGNLEDKNLARIAQLLTEEAGQKYLEGLSLEGYDGEISLPDIKRALYIHYNPEGLKLFVVRDKAGYRQIVRDSDYQKIERSRAGVVFRKDVRANLKDHVLKDYRKHLPEETVAQSGDGYVAAAKAIEALTDGAITMVAAKRMIYPPNIIRLRDALELERYFPRVSVNEWFEYMHHSALTYFLKRLPDGTVDYALPEDPLTGELVTPEQLLDQKWMRDVFLMAGEKITGMKRAKTKVRDFFAAVGRASGLGGLGSMTGFENTIKTGHMQDLTIQRLSSGLKLDKRLLYMYFRLGVTARQTKRNIGLQFGYRRPRSVVPPLVKRSIR